MPQRAGRGFSPELTEALARRTAQLVHFAHRLNHILSVIAELERVTRGKPFVIRHESMLEMVRGERDKIVIDLASWVLGFYTRGGFLSRIGGDDLLALGRHCELEPENLGYVGEEAVRVTLGSVRRSANAAWRDAAYARLFPSARGDVPTRRDIEALVNRLRVTSKTLRDDRDKHRAHVYENEPIGNVKMLAPPEVARELDFCKQLLADFRALGTNSTFVEHGYKIEADPDSHEAQDVVDLILRGPILDIAAEDGDREGGDREFYWQRRTLYYAALHEEHERRGDPEEPFNQAWWSTESKRGT